MSTADLNSRDWLRLAKAVVEARTRREDVPTIPELIPAVTKAMNDPGGFMQNLVGIFGEPIMGAFDLVRTVIVEEHGEEYADSVWQRFNTKKDA